MFGIGKRLEQRRVLGIGDDGIYADAWGRQKIVMDFSLFHSIFTYNVSDKLWVEYFNGVEQAKTNNTSVNGELVSVSNGGFNFLMSKRHPRYQPNRGLLFSNSAFLDNATMNNGKLYAVIRTLRNSMIVEDRQLIEFNDFKDFDPSKGNIYDIQMQWRGVGGIKFYINQKEMYHFDYLGKLDNLSISSPAMPISVETNNQGQLRFGAFAPEFGAFFEWQFNTPQETQQRCGCVDMTSEGGNNEKEQFLAVIGNELAVSNSVVLAIRIPNSFKGRMNTIDVRLAIIKAVADKKGDLEIYITRDATALTSALSWTDENGGNVQSLRPVVSADITFDKAKAQPLDLLPLLSGINNQARNPNPNVIDFYLTHGDILILNGVGANIAIRAIIQMGEEL